MVSFFFNWAKTSSLPYKNNKQVTQNVSASYHSLSNSMIMMNLNWVSCNPLT